FHPAQLLRLPFAVGGSAAGPPPAETVLTDQQVEDGPDKGEDENDCQPGQGNPNRETPLDDPRGQTQADDQIRQEEGMDSPVGVVHDSQPESESQSGGCSRIAADSFSLSWLRTVRSRRES